MQAGSLQATPGPAKLVGGSDAAGFSSFFAGRGLTAGRTADGFVGTDDACWWSGSGTGDGRRRGLHAISK